ncbi:MAG: serine hydrolase [Gammaproteobacteria bacterium]|nr:serine hydrolase [Gammaproteobacteria bacterium]
MLKKSKQLYLIVIMVTTILFLPGRLCAQTNIKINKEQLSTFINKWRVKNNMTAISLTVYTPANGYTTVYSGFKTIKLISKIDKNTPFQIGSITKTFTSMAILQQVAKGKIQLTNKIGRWFPQFPRWKNITIQQLLNMTSGIYRYMEVKAFSKKHSANPEYQWSSMRLIRLAYKNNDYFESGKGWHYSNTNYLILGLILENLTGESSKNYFKRYFFDKFKLKNTWYITHRYDSLLLKNIAHGYHNNQDITNYSMSSFGVAGAMLSTSNDIAHWVNAIFMGKVVPRGQLRAFKTTIAFSAPPKPKGSCYGLAAYYSHSSKYGDIWWYSGATDGYLSLFMFLPKYQLIIAATINHINGENYWMLMPTNDFANQLLKKLLVEQ